MLNQVAVEALYSATYVENYIDSVENLPDDVQRHLSRIRDIDVQYRSHLRDVDHYYEQWRSLSSGSSNTENSSTQSKRVRAMSRMQQNLIAVQELGDEKLQIVNQLQELIEHKTRQLQEDFKNLDYGKEEQLHHNNVQDTLVSNQKLTRPPSPTAIQQSSAAVIKIESISNSASASTTAPNLSATSYSNALPQSIHHNQRVNTPIQNQSFDKPMNNNNTSERTASKRSRRPRNDITSSIDLMNSGANDGSNSLSDNQQIQQQQKQNATNQSSNSQRKSTNNNKKKKRKTKSNQSNNQSSARDTRDDTPPPEEAIDPDEPTYCLCDQISFGEMILCDNDLCPIEWFHFSCVALMSKPKGKWFCPNCRGDRPNVMKPKAQFLKELERYNKEKEEKT